MKIKNIISLFVMIFILSSANIALATETTIESEGLIEPRIIESTNLDIEAEPVLYSENADTLINEVMPISLEERLEGIKEVEVPSRFSLFFKNIIETLDVAFTFSQEKKIEKILNYAENKIEIANKIMNSSNKENLEKRSEVALSMMENAERYINRIQNKEKILEMSKGENQKQNDTENTISKTENKTEAVMNRIMNIQNSKDRVYAQMENNVEDEEKLEKIIEQKQENYEKQEIFLNSLKEEETLNTQIKSMIQNRVIEINTNKQIDNIKIEEARIRNIIKEQEQEHNQEQNQEQEQNQIRNENREMNNDISDIMEKPEGVVMCTMEYMPVCGEDGKTYSNRCVAEHQNKVKVLYDGECRNNKNIDNNILPENSVTPDSNLAPDNNRLDMLPKLPNMESEISTEDLELEDSNGNSSSNRR